MLFSFFLDIAMSDGPGWKERRRFTLHHLRNLGFGKSSMESIVMEEIEKLSDHLKDNLDKDVKFDYFFVFSFLNIAWSIVGGEFFSLCFVPTEIGVSSQVTKKVVIRFRQIFC